MRKTLQALVLAVFISGILPLTAKAAQPAFLEDSCPPSLRERMYGITDLNPCVLGDSTDKEVISKVEYEEMLNYCVEYLTSPQGKEHLAELKLYLKEYEQIRPVDKHVKEEIKRLKAEIKLIQKALRSPRSACMKELKKRYKVSNSRTASADARDAQRLSDVRQIASALELFYNDFNRYPSSLASLSPTYVGTVPTAPTPAGKGCNRTSNTYTYTKITNNSYTLTFCLGKSTQGLSKGKHTMSEAGIR